MGQDEVRVSVTRAGPQEEDTDTDSDCDRGEIDDGHEFPVPVSYTHLDVYKRQTPARAQRPREILNGERT